MVLGVFLVAGSWFPPQNHDTLLDRDTMEAPFRYPVFNGEKIAFVWPDTIEIWNVTFESQIQTMCRNDIVTVALSPNEQKFASGSSTGSIRVWDIPSGMLLERMKVTPVMLYFWNIRPMDRNLHPSSGTGVRYSCGT